MKIHIICEFSVLVFLIISADASDTFDKNKPLNGFSVDEGYPKAEKGYFSKSVLLRQKRRKHGDTMSYLKWKVMARKFRKRLQTLRNDTHLEKTSEKISRRRKRYQYDEDYDWEDSGFDYESRLQPKKEETKFEKWAKNWQKNALKFIFLFSFLMMLCCCCCTCIKKLCSKTAGTICFHVREWRDLCLCRDPTYRRMRQMADEYGFDLDYSMYKKIKHSYERGLEREGHGKVDLSGR